MKFLLLILIFVTTSLKALSQQNNAFSLENTLWRLDTIIIERMHVYENGDSLLKQNFFQRYDSIFFFFLNKNQVKICRKKYSITGKYKMKKSNGLGNRFTISFKISGHYEHADSDKELFGFFLLMINRKEYFIKDENLLEMIDEGKYDRLRYVFKSTAGCENGKSPSSSNIQ